MIPQQDKCGVIDLSLKGGFSLNDSRQIKIGKLKNCLFINLHVSVWKDGLVYLSAIWQTILHIGSVRFLLKFI